MALKFAQISASSPLTLPAGAVIKSISYDGSITVESTCEDALLGVTVENYACYDFGFAIDTNSESGEGPMDSENFVAVWVDGVKYPFNPGVNSLGNTTLISTGLTSVFTSIPGQPIKFVSYRRTVDFTNRAEYVLIVKIIPSLASKVEIELTGTGYSRGLFLKPKAISCP